MRSEKAMYPFWRTFAPYQCGFTSALQESNTPLLEEQHGYTQLHLSWYQQRQVQHPSSTLSGSL